MNSAIVADGISKRYQIKAIDQPYYRTLRDSLSEFSPMRLLDQLRGGGAKPGHFWSLDNVSFDVNVGEVVGVIGRNGSGKSTLLKILSRITEPTRGSARIRGRVGSLLEVGTGFHEELTGRENLFLSGAILGMKRADIIRRFDAIVEFAELGDFVDTPVKFYSSGMYMRLAFSVAAHLEPDVLLVDEVLAVGDLEFQRKCLTKMESIAGEGRTVLFVSHNLAAVKALCQTCIVLKAGQLAYRGPAVNGVAAYLRLAGPESSAVAERGVPLWHDLAIDGQPALDAIEVPAGNPFRVSGALTCDRAFRRGWLSCHVANAAQDTLISQSVDGRDVGFSAIEPGTYQAHISFPALWLAPGVYSVWLRFTGEAGSRSVDYNSMPILLNVTGPLQGEGKSLLSVPVNWQVHQIRDRALA